MVLETQFRSVNYGLVAMICKNVKQNKPFWWWRARPKKLKRSHPTQQVFFNTIVIHIAVIYEKIGHTDEAQAVFEQLTLKQLQDMELHSIKYLQ